MPTVGKRPGHLLLGAACLGLALSSGPLTPILLVGASGIAPLAAARRPRLALLAAVALFAGWGAGQARLAAIDGPGRALGPRDRIVGSAWVLSAPKAGPFGSSAELRLTSGPARGARLLARFPRYRKLPPSVGVGSELRVAGAARRPRPVRAGAFDFHAYLRRKGVAGELAVTAARPTGRRRGGLTGAIDTGRRRAERAIATGLPWPRATLARAMVLGQDAAIDPAVVDDFRASGLAHVLAVSGQNVMLLVALSLPLLAAAGLSPGARLVVAIALIALYVPLAGAGPSLQRAGVMGAASLAALGLARPASRWYVLLLAACATLLLNPRACGDPGWQLSFAAVGGILTLAPPLSEGPLRGLPRLVSDGVAITVAATLATAPLVAHHFGTVSLAGLPANVLALPLVAPIMWLGMLRATLGQVLPPPGGSSALGVGAVAELVNRALGAALGPLTGALGTLAGAFSDVPGGQLRLPASSPALVAAAYAVLGLAAFSATRLAGRLEAPLTVAAARWRRGPPVGRVAVICVCAGVLALAFARLTAPPGVPGALTISFLDVGQGDATLIQHPDGSAVLFDGGPPEGRAARLLRRVGVRRLSAVVMTHASRDHHGGLLEVLERFPVGVLVDGGDGTNDRSFRRAVAAAKARGARRIPGLAPLTLKAGALTVRLLSPRRRPAGPPPEDPNPRAVVAVVSSEGFDLLLSADAESPTLSGLHLPDVDAMKVPHHGSADPGLPQVLERLRPEVASVPVGSNTYGHPTRSTLAALRSAGASVHRTDHEGTVRLTVRDGAIQVNGGRARPVGREP